MQTGQASVGAASHRRCGKPHRIVDAMKARRGYRRVRCGRENLWRFGGNYVESGPNGTKRNRARNRSLMFWADSFLRV